MQEDNIIAWLQTYLHTNNWILTAASILFLALLVDLFQRRYSTYVCKRLKRRHDRQTWHITLLETFKAPLSMIIWIFAIALIVNLLSERFYKLITPTALSAMVVIKDLLIVILVTWFSLRFIRRHAFNVIKYKKAKGVPIDETTAQGISQLLQLIIIIFAVLGVAHLLGFPISGIIAFGGVGGVAVGFAAKDLLGNLFGGLTIFFDRPFAVGDWIRSPDRQIEGTVEYIGWRLTRIRSFDKRPLYVPNGLFTNIIVENPSRMSNRRIYEVIGVRYDDANKIPAITHEIEIMIKNHPEIDVDSTLMVYLSKFSPSSLDITLYTFTKTTNWVKFQKIQQDVFLQAIEIIEKHGAECAFPTSTVHIPTLETNTLQT